MVHQRRGTAQRRAGARGFACQTSLATRKSALSGGDRRPDLAAGGVTLFGQDIAVPVAVMHRDPLVRHRAVDAALEIAVAHVEEMNAPQRAARLHLVTNEYAEDLAAGFFVGERVCHGYTGSTDCACIRARPFTRRRNKTFQFHTNLSTAVCATMSLAMRSLVWITRTLRQKRICREECDEAMEGVDRGICGIDLRDASGLS